MTLWHQLPTAAEGSSFIAELMDGSLDAALAHHYVRYLGDLFGGLIISRMVQRH